MLKHMFNGPITNVHIQDAGRNMHGFYEDELQISSPRILSGYLKKSMDCTNFLGDVFDMHTN